MELVPLVMRPRQRGPHGVQVALVLVSQLKSPVFTVAFEHVRAIEGVGKFLVGFAPVLEIALEVVVGAIPLQPATKARGAILRHLVARYGGAVDSDSAA